VTKSNAKRSDERERACLIEKAIICVDLTDSDTIISIIRLLYALLSRLYALFQDMKLQLGSVFIAGKIPLGRRARSTSAGIVLHDQSALIFAGRSGRRSITISVPDISKPTGTHGRTKLISQIIDSLCEQLQRACLGMHDSEDRVEYEPEKKQSERSNNCYN
jgi:hypothetical protein